MPAPFFAISYAHAPVSPGTFGRDRATVRRFGDASAMHDFLNRQSDNSWREHTGAGGVPLARGVYAMAGGRWQNVRGIERSVLAHI